MTKSERRRDIRFSLTINAVDRLDQLTQKTGLQRDELLEFWLNCDSLPTPSNDEVRQFARTRKSRGVKRGRRQVLFSEPKYPRHFKLTQTAVCWLEGIAEQHQIGRNAVVELWARKQLTVVAPLPNQSAIEAVRHNPHAANKGRKGYVFNETKDSTNLPLTDTAVAWLDQLAKAQQVNPSDLINLWAIGAIALPSAIVQRVSIPVD